MVEEPAKRFTLRSAGDSKVICCVLGESGYEDARAIWNGMVARAPGLIARCADVSDVQNAVRAASETGILTAIRCGGHSLAGFSTCDGGMVIDLSRMRQVTVDPEARRARIAGGCLLGSIDTATQKAGLVFPAGVVSHTGASGTDPGRRNRMAHPPIRIVMRQRRGIHARDCGWLRRARQLKRESGLVLGLAWRRR